MKYKKSWRSFGTGSLGVTTVCPGPPENTPRCSGRPGLAIASVISSFFAVAIPTLMAQSQAETTLPAQESVAALQRSIMEGPRGKMTIEQLVGTVVTSQELGLERTYLALALRKAEALPIVRDRLQSGSPYEKRAMTKLVRYLGWPEAFSSLVKTVTSDTEHPIARIGALYTLGAIGDKSAGPVLINVLGNAKRNLTEKRVAIATLARLGIHEAVHAITPFATHPDTLVRIFAIRALAELNQKPNTEPLFEALESDDYVVRQEACAALGSVGGVDAVVSLKFAAANDPHGSVRQDARIALLRIKIAPLPLADRVSLLEGHLLDEDKRVRFWALSTLATQCDEKGREVLRKNAGERTRIGQKCLFYLVAPTDTSASLQGGY